MDCKSCKGKGWEFVAMGAIGAEDVEVEKDICVSCNGTGQVICKICGEVLVKDMWMKCEKCGKYVCDSCIDENILSRRFRQGRFTRMPNP